MLDEIGRTEDDLRLMSQHGKGVLRLCTQCNTGYHWLPPLLQSFHRKFPGVDVQIMVNATDRPIEALLEGQIDLAVVTSDVDDKRLVTGAAVRRRARRGRRAVASVRQARVRRAGRLRRRAPDRLQRPMRSDSYTFTRVLAPAGVEPARVSQVPLTEAILELVKAGLGVSVMARWAIEPAIKPARCAPCASAGAACIARWTRGHAARSRRAEVAEGVRRAASRQALPAKWTARGLM